MDAIFSEIKTAHIVFALAFILFLIVFAVGLLPVAFSRTAIRTGFKSDTVSILGRRFLLIEITALQRLEYLKRCGAMSAKDGFELMRDDLRVSTDLIALHLRRWYLPRGFIAFRIQQLSAPTIAELFRHCVTLSGIPFSIESLASDNEAVTGDEPAADDDVDVDDWDYVDQEKKSRPVVRQ
jgi:hypothetical protein